MAEFECPLYQEGPIKASLVVPPITAGEPAVSVEVTTIKANWAPRCVLRDIVEKARHGIRVTTKDEPVTCALCGRSMHYDAYPVAANIKKGT